MAFYADLHVHSRYSRATGKDADLEHLALWGQRKGLSVVGTGDFTHPAWLEEIREKLVPAEPGLYRLVPEVEDRVARRVPRACRNPVRFALEVEISTIYKKGGRTRKVHHLVYAARLETVDELRRRLDRIGNLDSDGRPILGLDSRDLLEIVLESGDDAYLIPAHVWTPWFSALGSKSGFDSIPACYGDLSEHVFAAETGLSSDPPMNWLVSDLDRYRLVSNSDAHSPPKLAREACVFDTDLDYFRMREALETGEGYAGTVEFFPEEGKYHLDGHRKCGVRLEPRETRRRGGTCPECGKPVTVGVMHRVEELADRPPGARPEGREPFWSLVPLPEILGEVRDVGARTKTVEREFASLLDRLGPELAILRDLPMEEVEAAADPQVAEAVRRLRDGDVRREAGFDGEYGTIRLFDPEELRHQPAMGALLAVDDAEEGGGDAAEAEPGSLAEEGREGQDGEEERGAAGRSPGEGAGGVSAETPGATKSAGSGEPEAPGSAGEAPGADPLDALDPDQRRAAEVTDGPLLIVAGPGTGKTRTLTHRIAHLVESGEAEPEACLAVTFTRRAAAEMGERLERLVPEAAGRIPVTTFHGLGLRILRERPEAAGSGGSVRVAAPREQRRVAREALGLESGEEARSALREISERRREAAGGGGVGAGAGGSDSSDTGDAGERAARYVEALRERALVDFDDLLILPVRALEADVEWRRELADRWRWISVDEYQDVDPVQYRLVRLLAPSGSEVCAIGDPDQSIYGFRGAEVGFFLRFREDYPEARVVELTRNYRSTPAIVDAALGAVGPESLVDDRRVEPTPGEAPREVVLREAPTGRAEAEFVVHTIERLVGGTSYFSLDSGRVPAGTEEGHDLSFADFAVLYRTRRQAEPLVEALERSGIPCRRRSHEALAERPAVDRLVRALRELRDGPAQDGDAGTRPVSAGEGADGAADEGATVEAWLERALERALDRKRGGQLELLGCGEPSTGPGPGTGSDHDGADPGDEEPVSPSALREARRMLSPLAERHGSGVEDFLAALSLGAEVDAWDPRADRVSLLTLHAAKGLEFPVVFVVGCEDGLLPLRWGGSGDGKEDEGGGNQKDTDAAAGTGEERRLFFVGMTRAERRLYLTRARRRQMEGVPPEREPSPFLADIPPELLDRREHRPPGSGGEETGDTGGTAGAAEAADEPQLDLLG